MPSNRGRRRARVANALGKARWGVSTVGIGQTFRGLARYAALKASKPQRSTMHLQRSGTDLTFSVPQQLAPIPLIFGDVIDPEFRYLELVMPPDATVVDVGASIGLFIVPMAKMTGCVGHALEPVDANLFSLRANLAANEVADSIEVHRMAISDRVGTADMSGENDPWNSALGPSPENLDRRAGTDDNSVPVATLGSFLGQVGVDHVDVVKVNVAGHEPAVLDGAMPALAEARVDVLILLVGVDSLPRYEAMRDLGYRFFHFHPRTDRLHEVHRFDEPGFVASRPWPARHVIAIRDGAPPRWTSGRVELAQGPG